MLFGALIASLLIGVAESLGIQFIGADSGLIVVFLVAAHYTCRAAEWPGRREA